MADRERVGRFLRTLLGLFTVAWILVALFTPPDPFTFLLWLVPAWLLGAVAATWLVYRDGMAYLEASDLYSPRTSTSKAVLLFGGVAVLVKLLATAGANVLLGRSQAGYGIGVANSVLAVVAAYGFAFWANRYLRTLLGALTVATVVPGVFQPSLGPFAVALVVLGWLLAPVATVWLVAGGGFELLRASAWYRPQAPASQATSTFAVLVVLLKAIAAFLATFLAAFLASFEIGTATDSAFVALAQSLATSVLAVVGAYWIVYRAGAYGRLREWYLAGPEGNRAG